MRFPKAKSAIIKVSFTTETVADAEKEFATVQELATFLKGEPELGKLLGYVIRDNQSSK